MSEIDSPAPRAAQSSSRNASIDALRGLVMVFMLVDHARETWLLHLQVGDPVDASVVEPGLFFTRLLSTFCAPAFVALTGVSAWLYGQARSARETSSFLLKRGLFLIALELTFVGFAWGGTLPPSTFWLQVIWAIGISMVVLAALLHLPRAWQLVLGVLIVCGHNLLDGIVLAPEHPLFTFWAVLHQRSVIELPFGAIAKTSYPVLPWIGVMLLGYAAGPLFGRGVRVEARRKTLVMLGTAMVVGFVALRMLNVYGDRPWFYAESGLRTAMSFLSLTKYPPSLLFLLSTLGVSVLLLALFERQSSRRFIPLLSQFGAAPMFFYLLHLYVLRGLYVGALHLFGANKGAVYGVDSVATVWLWVAVLLIPLYLPTRWFAGLKQRRRDLAWLKYL